MPRWRWRFRKLGRGRPPSDIFLYSLPPVRRFVPYPSKGQPIELSYGEYEVIRLLDLEELTHEEAAKRMNTSRATVWRLAKSARKKIAQALTESRPIVIKPKGELEKV